MAEMAADIRLTDRMQKYVALCFGVVLLIISLVAIKNVAQVEQYQESQLALIVPHHDIVAAQRAHTFQEIRTRINPKRIILVSPNHKEIGPDNIITTTREWNVSGHIIKTDSRLIDRVTTKKLATIDDSFFVDEHGIKNILSDIEQQFPDAALSTFLVNEQMPRERLSAFATAIMRECAQDCLLIGSIDMSHYQPWHVAAIHDELTMHALQERNVEAAWNAEVDSNPTLALITTWATYFHKDKFHLSYHTNSGELIGNNDIETTSHLMGYFNASTAGLPINPSTTISIAGEIITDTNSDTTNFKTALDQLGTRSLWGTDNSFAFTSQESEKNPSPYLTRLFNYLHIHHAQPCNARICVITTNQELQTALQQFSLTLAQTSDDSVALVYWDDIASTNQQQEKIATQLIESGADLVVGNSHANQKIRTQLIKDRPVFYSLGTFLDLTTQQQNTQSSLLLTANFSNKTLTLVTSPIVIDRGRPRFARGEEKKQLLQSLLGQQTEVYTYSLATNAN